MKMDVVEYCNLSVIPLVDTCSIQNHSTILFGKLTVPTVVEVATAFNPVVFRISQSAIHTLGVANFLWAQNPATEQLNEQLLMNYYAICNDTQETVRFGQVDMDENIILRSRQMHEYSWRTHKSKQLLHVCVEGMHWKWCEPFDIDTVGTVVRHVEHKEQRATLIIVIKSLNKIQKQVLIRGPVRFMNFLNYPLEIKLTTTCESSNNKSVKDHRYCIASENTIATSIMEPKHLKSLQVQMTTGKAKWSKEIECNVKKKDKGILVQIPMSECDRTINAWCHFIYQPLSKSTQLFIIFAPMFIVETNLPRNVNLKVTTPGLRDSYSVEIEGKGKQHQLHFPGNPEITHHLSFQISSELESSKPALPLSTTMISQVSKRTLSSPFDVEDFYKGGLATCTLDWPYIDDSSLAMKLGELPPANVEHVMKRFKSTAAAFEGADQPNINLEVHLQQKWPYCNTLLISIKPWALITNQLLTEVCISSGNEEWKIGPEKIFASPKLEGSIQVGVKVGDKYHYSANMELTNDDWTFRHNWPRSYNKLPMQGFSQVPIFIDEETTKVMCYLTLNFKVKDGMQIIHIHPSYCIVNNSSQPLKLAPFVTRNTEEKINSLPVSSHQVFLAEKGKEKTSSCENIFMWELLHFNPADEVHVPSDYSFCLSFCNAEAGSSVDDWSLPCQLETSAQDSRFLVLIRKQKTSECESLDLPKIMTVPLTFSVHELNGVHYFYISDELNPQIILYNSCTIPLYFGESVHNSSEDFGIVEEMQTIYKLPCVKPGEACHYSFPSTMSKFPELHSSDFAPKLRFANLIVDDSSHSDLYFHWSSFLDISVENDVFLNIPNYSDVRVHMEKVGHSTHVFVEPVSRIEISAKEIRSRIKSKVQTYSPLCVVKAQTKELNTPQTKGTQEVVSVCDSDDGSTTLKPSGEERELGSSSLGVKPAGKHQQPESEALVFFTLLVRHSSIILMDTLTTRNRCRELARINIDDMACALRPRNENKKSKIKRNMKHELVFCLGCLQVDNQLTAEENFDFPVILVPQEKRTDLAVVDIVQSPELILQSVRNKAFLSVDVLMEFDKNDGVCVRSVLITTKPMLLYIEDSFLYKLVEILPTFSVANLQEHKPYELQGKSSKLPLEIVNRIYAYHHPIRIQHLKIETLTMMLSLHASLKLFISLDHSPLVFKPFYRSNILTTSYPIGRALTVHYLSGALIRAGWVVGSLDLLGNPGGFARAVSSGIADFVKLPYQGLMRGPWAFLSGIAHGSTSLVQQITAGTLVSITNLASSVSRNMEKLSLDETYRQQNEEIRRTKPDSVAQGFTQGLTGFGISLLGAIAGIIDQPLQTFQQSGNPNFPVGAVTGLISGVSKGIVGIVTKPLGGAAELVSQAGQGILYGTGWNKHLEIRYNPTNEGKDTLSNSQLKYMWKMLCDLPQTEIVFSVEATQIIQSGNYIPSVLLLTSHVLFIVNIEEDTQQQAFSLSEVECVGVNADPTLIYVTPLNPKPVLSSSPPEEKNTRVEEFVSKTVKYLLQGPEESERSESSSRDSPVIVSSNASMHFHVNPNMRNTFLALFKVVKNNMIDRGFTV